MVSHPSESDSESPQVSRTILSILVDLINGLVWMVSTCPLISKSFSPLVIVPSAPITIGITATFMFYCFNSLERSRYLSLWFLFIFLYGLPRRKSLLFCRCLFLLLTISGSSPRAEIGEGDPFVSQNRQEFCVSHSPG